MPEFHIKAPQDLAAEWRKECATECSAFRWMRGQPPAQRQQATQQSKRTTSTGGGGTSLAQCINAGLVNIDRY
jgi:hypothetical protein